MLVWHINENATVLVIEVVVGLVIGMLAMIGSFALVPNGQI